MNEPMELLKVVLSLSLSGSLLILLLMLGHPLLRDRLSRRCQYYLWLVVVARLLLPFALETNLVGTLFSWDGPPVSAGTAPPVSAAAPLPEADPTLPEDIPQSEVTPVQPVVSPAPSAPERSRWPSPEALAFAVWMLGALGLFAWRVIAYHSFLRQVRKGWKEVPDPAVLDLLAKAGAQVGVQKPVELYVNPAIFSPMMLGVLQPCIVLPSTDLPESELRCTLLHELTHYRRSDMLYKWLVQGAVCVHWFNPLVHWMAGEINRACELSCDEAVIRRLDEQGRRDYGDTLLHAMEAGCGYHSPALPLHDSKGQLKERLSAIMKFHAPTPMSTLGSLAAVLCLLIGAVAAGAYVDPFTPEQRPYTAQFGNEPGVYYICVDGADYKDKPDVGTVGGVASFVLVRPDSYVVVSGFDSLDNLADQVREQCSLMVEQQTLTQEEADRIIQKAESTWLDAVVPISIKGDPAYEHYYTQNGYYQDSRLFELGWNVREEAADSYDSVKLTLSDGTELTVLYNDVCWTWMQDQETLDALTALLDRLWTEQRDFPPVRPLLVSVNRVVDSDLADLARQYYGDNNPALFSAVFPLLSQDAQRRYLDLMYENEQIDFFSVSLSALEPGSPLPEHYLEQAYNDVNFDVFSICLKCLPAHSPLFDSYAELSYSDGMSNLFSILMDYLSQETLDRCLEQAARDGRTGYWSMLLEKTGREEEPGAWKADQEKARLEDYQSRGITVEGSAYFYQGQRTRIFWDCRPDNSFITLNYDAQGTVDVRVIRDEDENIASVGFMTAAEAEEFIRDMQDDGDDRDDFADGAVNVLGFDTCRVITVRPFPHHRYWHYFVEVNGEEICIAEPYGFSPDAWIVDLDGDGVTELVCNCMSGGDCVQSIHVFRNNGGVIEEGYLSKDYFINDLGMNLEYGPRSFVEEYDPDKQVFVLTNYENKLDDPVKVEFTGLEHFVFEPFQHSFSE